VLVLPPLRRAAFRRLFLAANSEFVATEIVRTLVRSIGLVASAPLTTWLASLVVAGAAVPPQRRRRRSLSTGRR
jgi:uncharacterized membrane protein